MSVLTNLRELRRDLARYGLMFVLTHAASLVMLPLLTRILSVDDFGAVDVIAIAVAFGSQVLRLALPSGLARYYSELVESERARLASTLIALVGLTGVATLAVLSPMLDSLSRLLFEDDRFARALGLGLLIGFLQALASIPEMLLRLERRIYVYSALRIADSLAYVGLAFPLVLGLRRGVEGVFEAQLLAAAATLVASLTLTRGALTTRLSLSNLGPTVAFSLPLVPAGMASWLAPQLNRLFLLWLDGLGSVALFGVAFRLGQLGTLPGQVYGNAWQPYAMLLVNDPDRNATYRVSFTYYAATMASLGLLLTAAAPELVVLLAPDDYRGSSALVPWLLAGVTLRQSLMFTRLGALSAERPGLISLAHCLSLGLNGLLALLLIRPLGTLGAAIAFAASALFLSTLLAWLSARVSDIRFDTKRLLFVLGIFGLLSAGLVAATGATSGWASLGLRLLLLLVGLALLSRDLPPLKSLLGRAKRRAPAHR